MRIADIPDCVRDAFPNATFVASRVTECSDFELDKGIALGHCERAWLVVSWFDGGTCPRCSGYDWSYDRFNSEVDARRKYQWGIDHG